MSADIWVPVLGVPIIALLLVQTVRRVGRLKARIAQVREEQASNPLPPYAQLAQLMADQETRGRRNGKRTH